MKKQAHLSKVEQDTFAVEVAGIEVGRIRKGQTMSGTQSTSGRVVVNQRAVTIWRVVGREAASYRTKKYAVASLLKCCEWEVELV